MEERIEYQVLAPDSVAWYIQAALTADRSGNVAARDVALREAQRIAEERGVDGNGRGYDVAHECNGVRLAELESQHYTQTMLMRSLANRLDMLSEMEERLATIERRLEDDAATLGEHARRIDGLTIGAPRRPGAYFIPGGRLIEIERRVDALEQSQVASPWPLMIQRLHERIDRVDAQNGMGREVGDGDAHNS